MNTMRAGEGVPDQAKLVRAVKDGISITDGVFPEGKAFLAGYWIVDVESPERAYAGAALLNMAIEVRPVMSGPPPEML
ncbi:MAG TPA: hypothetical protein VG168_02830 [Bryobacteraceae bacterium]|nr:hypothetical protein [Bryobacteraceae bacterium]